MTTADRIHGALLGTLIGDAFGRPFEGSASSDLRLPQAIDVRAANPHGWDYSDDGEMALAVAESITAHGSVDERHLLTTLAARHEPARGYGKGIRAAFRALEETGDWRAAPRALWPEGSRGNGSAVRVAGVAAWHVNDDDPRSVSDAAVRSAAPTHAHPDAVDATRAMALAMWRLMRGEPRAGLRAWLMGADPAFGRLLQPQRTGRPLAMESVALALRVFDRGSSFAGAVQSAVALGHDTDTNAAMVGALAGATDGRAAIPDDWVAALPPRAVRRAADLAKRLSAQTPSAPHGWRTDVASVASSANEDRLGVDSGEGVAWIAMADGAGGTGRGAEAAELVVQTVRATRPTSGRAMMRLLEATDAELAARASGLSTAVVLRMDGVRVVGASVGDSVAWARGPSGWEELTEHQSRRPLIGSGRATPLPFVLSRVGRVLVATDGLSAYLANGELTQLLDARPSAATLLDTVRLPSGALRDDTTVVLADRE